MTANRAALAADLERARADFHDLLSVVGEDDWHKSTVATRWTNEQLLFHMVFGYMVVQRLLILVRLFGRLPESVSRSYARILNAATNPFNAINYYGTCMAASFYNRHRMGAKMDRTIAGLQRTLGRARDDVLRRSMYFPTRWDPYFRDLMTIADVYLYPGQHYDHHRRQLTLSRMTKPAVLFLCTHNAGRSQMALGFFNALARDQATGYSGGSEPAEQINPAAIAAMAEKGIDITAEQPKRWTDDMVQAADVVVTMGCGDTCPFIPGRRYVDWVLPDPAGQPLEVVRPIRDDIEDRVRLLLSELGVAVAD
jgi:protein-tyrosine-phosphatase